MSTDDKKQMPETVQFHARQKASPSNANNFRSAIGSHVNPRTGKLLLSIHAPVLPGIGKLDVDLGLEYTQADGLPPKPILGLPPMWCYRLSYIVDGQIVINGRQSFAVDPHWVPRTGMRYQSLRNMTLESIDPIKPLPYDQTQHYRYKLKFLHGKTQYFDNHGRMIAIDDPAGNHVLFYYSQSYGNVHETTLKQVIDSYGQTIALDCNSESICVTFPSGGSQQLSFTYKFRSSQGLTEYHDPAGRVTRISYGHSPTRRTVISGIHAPNQLDTSISYGVIHCKTPDGESYLDVVSSLDHQYKGDKRTIKYSFSPGRDQRNYSGYPEYMTATSEDQLLTSNDNRYRYYSTVDNGVTITKHTYNNLHLQLQEDTYVSSDPSSLISSTSFYYLGDYLSNPKKNPTQEFTNFQNLPPTYQMPTEITTRHYNPGNRSQSRATKTRKTYDDAGQVTNVQRFTAAHGADFDQIGETDCQYDSKYGQITTKDDIDYQAYGVIDTHNPVISRLERTLTADGSRAESSRVGFVTGGRFHPSRSTAYHYDGQGRVTHQSYGWADGGHHDVPGTHHDFAYRYDAGAHQLTLTRTDALGHSENTVVDTTTGFTLSHRDANGNTTHDGFDGAGRRTRDVDALGVVTTWSYDDARNLVTVHHQNGYEGYFTFDGFGKLVAHADNCGSGGAQRTLYTRTYGDFGHLKTETGVLGAPTTLTYHYDDIGRLDRVEDAAGNVRSYAHDAVAQTRTESYNGIEKQILTFDHGKPVRSEKLSSDNRNDTIVTSAGYNSAGHMVRAQVGAEGAPAGQVRCLTLDILSHPIEVVTQGSDGTKLMRTDQRDLLGHIVQTHKSLSTAEGTSTALSSRSHYNAVGQLTRSDRATGGHETFTHDRNGNITERVDLSATSFTYEYDGVNTVHTTSFDDGNIPTSLHYGYDPDSHRLTSLECRKFGALDSRIDYTYQLDGKLTQVRYGEDGPTLNWDYDAATGQLAAFTDASGVTCQYGYQEDGRLRKITHPSGDALLSYYTKDQDHAHSGRLKTITYADQAQVDYTYDGFGRTRSVAASRANGSVVTVVYSYDPVSGNVTGKQSRSPHHSNDHTLNSDIAYQYNGLGQLTRETISAGGDILVSRAFVYDAAGNVTECTASGSMVPGGTTRFTYDADNRLQTVTGPDGSERTLSYDDNGNLTDNGAGHSLRWNALEQLIGFSASGGDFTYRYYPDGLRYWKMPPGEQPVMFYYDHQKHANIVNEIQSKTAADSHLAGNRRLSRRVGGQVTAHFDDRKSVVATVSGGDVVGHRYGAEGRLDFPPGAEGTGRYRLQDNPFLFSGEYRDSESGYVYLRARYYDPDLMRFVSRDRTAMFNRYSYCATNPVVLADPSGHAPWWDYLIQGLAAVAGLAITLGSGGTATGVAAAIFGASEEALAAGELSVAVTTGVNSLADAMSSAAGAIGSDAVTAIGHSIAENHWAASQFFNANLAIDVGASFVGAAIGTGVKTPLLRLGESTLGKAGRLAQASRILCGAVGGVVENTTTEIGKELAKTHKLDWKSVMELGVAKGIGAGVGGAFFKEVSPFLKSAYTATKLSALSKVGRAGTYDLDSWSQGTGELALPGPPSGPELELLSFRHAEFDEDIDAPVVNRIGAHSSAAAGSDHGGGHATSTDGYVLTRL